jgi:hypothetical protein
MANAGAKHRPELKSRRRASVDLMPNISLDDSIDPARGTRQGSYLYRVRSSEEELAKCRGLYEMALSCHGRLNGETVYGIRAGELLRIRVALVE